MNEIKQKYIRSINRTKKDDYLSVSIPSKLTKQLGLDHNSYVWIYTDNSTNYYVQVEFEESDRY